MTGRQYFPDFYGNEKLCAMLGADIESGRLGHAYILEGDPGTGKHTLAQQIAAADACEYKTDRSKPLPCGSCLSCRKILGGQSTDVTLVGRSYKQDGERATLGVGVVRAVRDELWLAPNENDKKYYIIEDTDTMTPQAQNALLLSLEEPPPFAVFFLLAEDASALLDTVRSRAPTLRLRKLSVKDMEAALTAVNKAAARLAKADPDRLAAIIKSSGGSLGTALSLVGSRTDKTAKLAGDHAMMLVEAALDGNSAAAFKLPSKRDEILPVIDIAIDILGDLVCARRAPEGYEYQYFQSAGDAKKCASGRQLQRICIAADAFVDARDKIKHNAAIPTVLIDLCTMF